MAYIYRQPCCIRRVIFSAEVLQETLKHMDYLTPNRPVEFHGRTIKKKSSGQNSMEFSQKFIDNLLGLFKATAKVTTNGVKILWFQKRTKSSDKESHSLFRTAVGKFLWTSQLRDDIKYPVKELLRSLSNLQESDFDNLMHLLKFVNETRDFIFLMEPQAPAPNAQGLIPVEIISYSDSDWPRCQMSRRSTSASLITLFSVNIASTSRTQASVSQSFSVSLISRGRAPCDDSSYSRVTCDHALHSGIQIRDFFQ